MLLIIIEKLSNTNSFFFNVDKIISRSLHHHQRKAGSYDVDFIFYLSVSIKKLQLGRKKMLLTHPSHGRPDKYTKQHIPKSSPKNEKNVSAHTRIQKRSGEENKTKTKQNKKKSHKESDKEKKRKENKKQKKSQRIGQRKDKKSKQNPRKKVTSENSY